MMIKRIREWYDELDGGQQTAVQVVAIFLAIAVVGTVLQWLF